MERPRRAVEEIFRVLRPGGRFNIHLYAFWSLSHLTYRIKFGSNWKLHVENRSENRTGTVRIDLYTAAKLRQLLSPAPIEIQKYHWHHAQALGRWLGWFIVAKGSKP